MNHIYQYIIAGVIITLMSACMNEKQVVSSDTSELETSGIVINQNQFASNNFELGKIEQQPFSKMLNVTGYIHIPERSMATVSTLMSGTLSAINLLEGQWVKKGQKLFSVTNPELINLQEDYLVANGRLEYLREEYNRQLDLSNEKLSTRNDILKAKSELTTTQARHGSLSKKLTLYNINPNELTTNNLVSSMAVTAPISGYVSEVNAMQGMYIEPNQSALTLANTSHLHLHLSVLEKDAMLLAKNQKIVFTLQGDHSKKYHASIHLINKSIDQNHMIIVHCEIDGDTKKLVPGMFVNASISLDKYSANALPESALVKMDENYFGLILKQRDAENMTFETKAIDTGENQNGYVEVKETIPTNTEFLTKGAYFLVK